MCNLEQLVDVVPDIVIHELGIESPKICIVDVLEYERRCFALSRLEWHDMGQ